MDHLPPLPALTGEIILDVFTHRSLRFPGAPTNDEYGDNDRLAALGKQALELAITDALFKKRPMLNAQDIESRREELLEHPNLDSWVSGYKLRDKLRSSLDAREQILRDPKETKHLFCSYVGALYVQSGMSVIQGWIGTLVDPSYDSQPGSRDPHSPAPPEPMYQPPPPANPPPPLPNPLAPAQPQAAFLPLFNQTAMQRRLAVEYPATFTGPAHAGRWTVKCVVNNTEKGIGHGPSKQLAKEEAARQAYFAMGWAPRM
ncbi:hypothetical protein K474DRAFT_1591679 [Panus rudis PR-1116 ss-1]|nr:hypothetical protein K474DRAFT_1591679 [Panus rudis PR-1116 ss-1]